MNDAPWWLVWALWPGLAFVLFLVWMVTRPAKSEVTLKGFGVELTLKGDDSKGKDEHSVQSGETH